MLLKVFSESILHVTMKKILFFTILGFTILSLNVWAQKAQIKMEDIPTNENTSITIQKGAKPALTPPDYEIVSGQDEITGDEEFDDKKALSSWKSACESWKSEIRELNIDNKVIMLSCGARKKSKVDAKFTFTSTASYKVRVKIRDK
jgi:hypothetical protein